MKYSREKSNDWVKFKPGVASRTIAQVIDLSNNAEQLCTVIEACHFEHEDGRVVDELPTARDIYNGLTFAQFDWLGKQVIKWARDEALDPEA